MWNGIQIEHGCSLSDNSLRANESQDPANEILRSVGEDPIELQASAQTDVPTTQQGFKANIYNGGFMYPHLNLPEGPYSGPVVADLAGMKIKQVVPAHREHDVDRPVAHTDQVINSGTRLDAHGFFSIDNDDSREIISGRKKGFPFRPSLGLINLRYRKIRQGETLQANGRSFVGPFLFVYESELDELGIVTRPGDRSVEPIILASLNTQGNIGMDFAAYVASLGLDLASLTPEAEAALRVSFAEMQEPAPDLGAGAAPAAGAPAAAPAATASANPVSVAGAQVVDLAASYRQTIAAEELRATQVRQLCNRFGNPEVSIGGQSVNLAAHAIAQGWNADQVELQARRHQELETARDSRPRGPAVHTTSQRDRGSIDALQGALMLRAGIALDHAAFGNQDIAEAMPSWLQANINDPTRQRAMDNAHEFASFSMIDLCAAALRAEGQMVGRNRMNILQASFSSGTVSQLFGATIGAKVLTSYNEIKDFSIGWTQEDENPDMETHARIRMESAQDLTHHPIGGEASHATRRAINESTKVERFSRQMTIDEADFLGDNFGKLKDTPRDFGLAAGRVRPNLVAAVMLANANLLATGRALFNTTDGSTVSSGYGLSRTSLAAAISRIALRKDGDASINLDCTHLLVGPSNKDLAIQLAKSDTLSNDSGSGSKNTIKDYNLTVVSEARLENGLVDPVSKQALSGSATDWFVVSSQAPTIEVTFLEGAGRVPVVRTTQLTNGEFGLNIDVRHYIGARAMDFKGFFRGRA